VVSRAGAKAGEFASKAKGPLLAGGAAIAGAAAGAVALKSRTGSKGPLQRLGGSSLPKTLRKADLGKLDFESLTSAGKRVGKIGQQVGAVAEAAEKARKKS